MTSQPEDRRKLRICILFDDISLGNLNPPNPLEVTQAVEDRGIEIRGCSAGTASEFVRILLLKTSNYWPDFGVQNRGFLYCSAVPEDGEFERFLSLKTPDAFSADMRGRSHVTQYVQDVLSAVINPGVVITESCPTNLRGNAEAAFGN